MHRLQTILSELSDEDLTHGLTPASPLAPFSNNDVMAVAQAVTASHGAIPALSTRTLVFAIAKTIATIRPFRAANQQNTARINARAFYFLVLHGVADNAAFISAQCSSKGKRCDGGKECLKAEVQRWIEKRPKYFESETAADGFLSQITCWDEKTFFGAFKVVLASPSRCAMFKGHLLPL